MLGRRLRCGPFAHAFGVADGGGPQGRALGVPLAQRIPLRVSHAFDDAVVHADTAGADLLVPVGWVRGIGLDRWVRRVRWFRHDGGWFGRWIRHRPPEPQPRLDASPRTAPADPHAGVDFGCLAAR